MSLYRVPRRSENWRPFRILAWGTVLLLVGILIFLLYDPIDIGDSGRELLGWATMALMVSVIVVGTGLVSRANVRKLKESYQFELSDGRLSQTREGNQTVEIPLAQIASLHQTAGWLLVKGGELHQKIAIPTEVSGFEELKTALVAYCPVALVKPKVRFLPILILMFLAVACFFLVTSHNRRIVLAAGGTFLLLQGLGSYSICRLRKKMPRPTLVLFLNVMAWLLMAWVVYLTAKRAM